MPSRVKGKLTYANVVATLALVVAVGGGSTAIAITAAKDSVRSTSIKNGQVAGPDLADIRVAVGSTTLTDPNPGDGQEVTGEARARCRGKERLIGGGAGGGQNLKTSQPATNGANPRAWSVSAGFSGSGSGGLVAYALCLRAKP